MAELAQFQVYSVVPAGFLRLAFPWSEHTRTQKNQATVASGILANGSPRVRSCLRNPQLRSCCLNSSRRQLTNTSPTSCSSRIVIRFRAKATQATLVEKFRSGQRLRVLVRRHVLESHENASPCVVQSVETHAHSFLCA
jgi:hypothetical protein